MARQAHRRAVGYANVIVVPWGEMYHIPFASLHTPGTDGEPGSHMGARWQLTTSPSAGVYRYLRNKQHSGRESIFAVGNPKTHLEPLVYAEREAGDVSDLFEEKTLLTGEVATETRLGDLGAPDVVHLAVHGVFDSSRPLLSHLVLAPDETNDGRLELHEVFGLNLEGVSLVTLSACSSGQSQLGAGDDLVGLTRGFFFAGAPSILASLWRVDDEATGELMLAFYRAYMAGESKPRALQLAQEAVRSQPKWSHPYYWAPFVLFGDWR